MLNVLKPMLSKRFTIEFKNVIFYQHIVIGLQNMHGVKINLVVYLLKPLDWLASQQYGYVNIVLGIFFPVVEALGSK
ncbi:unnamed protein product [Trichobilharzia regenti]|nr:unnamed protein product [Trichobilharzia regenti]